MPCRCRNTFENQCVSHRTIEHRIEKMKADTGDKNVTELAIYAVRDGLVDKTKLR